MFLKLNNMHTEIALNIRIMSLSLKMYFLTEVAVSLGLIFYYFKTQKDFCINRNRKIMVQFCDKSQINK